MLKGIPSGGTGVEELQREEAILDFEVQICKVELQVELLRSDSRLVSLIILSGTVHTGVEVHRMDLWNDLGFSLCAMLSVCCMVTTSDEGKKV